MSPKTQIILGTTLQENIGLDKQFLQGHINLIGNQKRKKFNLN